VAGSAVATTTIDPLRALEEWIAAQIPRHLARVMAHSGAFAAFVAAAPGVRELLAATKAWELGEKARWRPGARAYDTVVLDAPASGHGVGMLRAPGTFAAIARVGPIATQARTVDDAVRDPARCALVGVTRPDELAVGETLELESQLMGGLGRGLGAIVVNGVWPRRVSGRDAQRVSGVNGALAPALARSARAAAARVRTQDAQLTRLREEARAPIVQLPFVFAEALGDEHIARLSARLATEE
jgi:hypothetical protein